ncbi:MAG: peptidase C1 [Candidatus Brocadiae bacterium]|nr:peptidase C1 [Candidatus Brocadiia bacterium]
MRSCIFCILILVCSFTFAQDKGVYKEYKNKFFQGILDEIEKFEKTAAAPETKFRMDFTGKQFPTDLRLYTTVWHNEPISQGNSGTCWAYCTTSFFESEIFRLTGKKVKLSEMYTVYWEIVEKARRFVQQRGDSLFAEGSQGNAVPKIWRKYGIVPHEAYTAMKPGQKFHNHETMFNEMKKYLDSVKANNAWNEKQVLETIQSILHHYMSTPPEVIVVDGKKMTPKEYLASLNISLDDYVDFLSLTKDPYYQLVEYTVPDNWWHNKEYVNVPLEDFMWVLQNALSNGYSVDLGGDVSEPGYDMFAKVGVVPSFDIPSEYINEHARMFRFSNNTTTDDHGIHCVGFLSHEGKNWYLIKDSGSGSRNVEPIGYVFYHEDYIKLKIMNIMVHKDAAGKVWQKYLEVSRK